MCIRDRDRPSNHLQEIGSAYGRVLQAILDCIQHKNKHDLHGKAHIIHEHNLQS